MKKLVQGILEFRQHHLAQYKKNYAHLALGQFPDTLFIACSDSRVVPNLFASTNPGDLFVVRNVANLVPPVEHADENNSASAAIEFSLTSLPISNILICGHSECGGMQAVLKGIDNIEYPHLKNWLQNCDVSVDDIENNQEVIVDKNLSPHNKLSQINVVQQMKHVMTYPLVQEKMQDNTLKVHGWYFDIFTGDVYMFDKESKHFILMDEKAVHRFYED